MSKSENKHNNRDLQMLKEEVLKANIKMHNMKLKRKNTSLIG